MGKHNNKRESNTEAGSIASKKPGEVPYQHGSWKFDLSKDYNLYKSEELTNDSEINSQLRDAYAKAIEMAKRWVIEDTTKEVDLVKDIKDPQKTLYVWSPTSALDEYISMLKESKDSTGKSLPFMYRYCMHGAFGFFVGTRYDQIMLSSQCGALGLGLYPVESEVDVVVKVYKIADSKPVKTAKHTEKTDPDDPVKVTVSLHEVTKKHTKYTVKIDLDNPTVEPDLQGPHGPHVGYEVHKIGAKGVEKVVIGHVLINTNEKLPSRYKANYDVPCGLRNEDGSGKKPVGELMSQCDSNFNMLPFKESPEGLYGALKTLNEKNLECVGPGVQVFIPVSRALAGPLTEVSIESLRHCLERKDGNGQKVVSQASDKLDHKEKTFVEMLRKTKFDRPRYPSADF